MHGRSLISFWSFSRSVKINSALASFLTDLLKYYVFTKDTLPMDVEFIIQDTLALVRPEWKLAPNFEEAARAFSEAVTQNYTASNDKTADQDSGDESLSDNDLDASEDRKGRKTDPQSSGDEVEVGRPVRRLLSLLQC